MNQVAAMAADGEANNQVNKSTANMDSGTRLRRRLSKIFHRESAEIGFGTDGLRRDGTLGSNQPAICQSPRIQR